MKYLAQDFLKILYQDKRILIVQTTAGQFDKFSSQDIYGQFNLGLHVGDDAGCVLKRRADLLLGLKDLTYQKTQTIFWLNQIHSNEVRDVNDDFFTKNQNADALISHQKYQALAIMTADCVPIAIFDDKNSIACIHAGWQGLTSGIIKNTALKFDGGQLRAVIGACISQKNYEIDVALAQKIVNEVVNHQLTDLSFDELYQRIIKQTTHKKCTIDLVLLTKLQLKFLDIQCLNDKTACTYQQTDLYSYRAQTHAKKTATGRMAMVIVQI